MLWSELCSVLSRKLRKNRRSRSQRRVRPRRPSRQPGIKGGERSLGGSRRQPSLRQLPQRASLRKTVRRMTSWEVCSLKPHWRN